MKIKFNLVIDENSSWFGLLEEEEEEGDDEEDTDFTGTGLGSLPPDEL